MCRRSISRNRFKSVTNQLIPADESRYTMQEMQAINVEIIIYTSKAYIHWMLLYYIYLHIHMSTVLTVSNEASAACSRLSSSSIRAQHV